MAATDVLARPLDPAAIRSILEHPDDHPWKIQEIGLLGLWLDDRREYRLHVWDQAACSGEPPIHDHPFDFTSTVIVGELTNTRYTEDPAGVEYQRMRYRSARDDERRADTVRLAGAATTFVAGGQYRQLAHELHDSRQVPGTVTVIRCAFGAVDELTVCTRDGTFVSGQSRRATPAELRRITCAALALF